MLCVLFTVIPEEKDSALQQEDSDEKTTRGYTEEPMEMESSSAQKEDYDQKVSEDVYSQRMLGTYMQYVLYFLNVRDLIFNCGQDHLMVIVGSVEFQLCKVASKLKNKFLYAHQKFPFL